MKKGQYYFDKLSEVEQKQFTTNYNNEPTGRSFDAYLKKEFISFTIFLFGAFLLMATPEGLDYWHEIANRKVD